MYQVFCHVTDNVLRLSRLARSKIMAQLMGPYSTLEIEFWIGENERGAYVVGKEIEKPIRIGISDDLRSEIAQISKVENGRWFEFYPSISPIRLFEVQCEWYHRYHSLRSSTHPSPPHDYPGLQCPVEGCSYKE